MEAHFIIRVEIEADQSGILFIRPSYHVSALHSDLVRQYVKLAQHQQHTPYVFSQKNTRNHDLNRNNSAADCSIFVADFLQARCDFTPKTAVLRF